MVLVDGSAVRPSLKLKGGEELVLEVPPPLPSLLEPEPIPLKIIHRDEDLLVVYKPAGLVVHPAAGHRTGTLVHALLYHIPALYGVGGSQRPGLVHRLDKGTSGLLVVALNDPSLRRLQAQFMIHTVERRYLAVVRGRPDSPRGVVRSNLARHPRDRTRFASCRNGGKPAITHWRLLCWRAGFSLLACRLETGRTHQVRVHLSESGWPVVGDPLYGGRGKRASSHPSGLADVPRHQLLHASHLSFQHPVSGKIMTFMDTPPEDFREFCQEAGLPIASWEAVLESLSARRDF